MSKQHIKPAYAKFDPAHVFDGLFVPTNGKKRGKLFVPLRQFGAVKIGFQGFDQLGADDQSILLAITAQLGIDGLSIDPIKPMGPVSKQLRLDVYKPNNGVLDDSALKTKKTSLRSLLIDAGYKDVDNGKAMKIARDSLNRLCNAQIREVGADGWDRRCNLISTSFNEITGEVYVAANPRLSGAVFRGQHVKISLFERNLLHSEAAKILHCWLSSNIRLGKALGNGTGAHIDTLAPHVWGVESWEKASRQVKYNRRSQLRDALDEIDAATRRVGTPWAIDQDSSGLVLVSRPKQMSVFDELLEGPHRLKHPLNVDDKYAVPELEALESLVEDDSTPPD